MASRAEGGIQIPDVADSPGVSNADTGYMRVFFRNGNLTVRMNDGREFGMSQNMMDINGIPLFIQDTQPDTTAEKYLWIQTNVDNNPDDFTFYFEDGNP